MLGSHANDEAPHTDGSFWAAGKQVLLAFPKFTWETPKDSPVSAPDDTLPGQNEFTFTIASPGVLNLEFEIKVEPPGIAAMLVDKAMVNFSEPAPTITGSTYAWAAANATPPGKPTVAGDNLKANATYTTLPAANDQFGVKKAHFACTGMELAGGDFEVFFTRDDKNHPGPDNGVTPNWYYYWLPIVGGGNDLEYGGASLGATIAEVKGITTWIYAAPRNKTRITIYDGAVGKFRAYGVGEEFSGIDQFAGTVVHEAKHVDQIARADALVPTGTVGTPWQFGWSFNQGAAHNHWTLGPDGKPGVLGVDDDGDGIVDNLVSSGPGELGHGDDIDLTHPTTTSRNWPSAWLPPVPLIFPLELEAEAINAADAAVNEHQHARTDWGNPGKNHKTIDKYDD